MLKMIFVVLLLASPVFAQDEEEKARMAAGCGPNEIKFDVKTDKNRHPMGQPEQGKALVYIFGDENEDNGGFRIGGLTTRIGVDGTWVGANDYKSYFFFSVDPGDHRICTSWQSMLKGRTRKSSATSFTAEAGKVYYFRTKTPTRPQPGELVKLVPVDPAQAQLLIASSAFSTSKVKQKPASAEKPDTQD
jgi:uncharacterized protein DUF2846